MIRLVSELREEELALKRIIDGMSEEQVVKNLPEKYLKDPGMSWKIIRTFLINIRYKRIEAIFNAHPPLLIEKCRKDLAEATAKVVGAA